MTTGAESNSSCSPSSAPARAVAGTDRCWDSRNGSGYHDVGRNSPLQWRQRCKNTSFARRAGSGPARWRTSSGRGGRIPTRRVAVRVRVLVRGRSVVVGVSFGTRRSPATPGARRTPRAPARAMAPYVVEEQEAFYRGREPPCRQRASPDLEGSLGSAFPEPWRYHLGQRPARRRVSATPCRRPSRRIRLTGRGSRRRVSPAQHLFNAVPLGRNTIDTLLAWSRRRRRRQPANATTGATFSSIDHGL
jgi:hypothetical protein